MSDDTPKCWQDLKIDMSDHVGLGQQNEQTTRAVNAILDHLAFIDRLPTLAGHDGPYSNGEAGERDPGGIIMIHEDIESAPPDGVVETPKSKKKQAAKKRRRTKE